MAHPYFHSLSSVSNWGGVHEDYLAVHQWFDRSKQHLGDFRHRALRHHAEGIDLSRKIFGDEITNRDGVSVPVDQLGRQHIEEDLGYVPAFSDWLEAIDDRSIPRAEQLSSPIQADRSVLKWGGVESDYLPLHEFLDEAVAGAGRRSFLARHHTEGVFLLETVFGAVITNSEGRVVPVRVIAEFHINNELSRIPPVSEILQGIETAPWMMRVARPSRLIMRSLQETS